MDGRQAFNLAAGQFFYRPYLQLRVPQLVFRVYVLLDAYLTPKQYGLNHYAIRFLSLNYELDARGRLQKTRDYRVPKLLTILFQRQAFLIPENVRLINRFIRETDFMSFFQEYMTFGMYVLYVGILFLNSTVTR